MKLQKGFTLIEVLVVLSIVVILAGVLFSGVLVPESRAVKALETHGFSDVKVTHKAIFFVQLRGGSKSDSARFTCTATNPAGKRVEVYVFSGWPFKGTTVRTD